MAAAIADTSLPASPPAAGERLFPAAVLEMARRAAMRLVRIQQPSGLLLYEYDPATGRTGRGFNMVRMAGAAYSLCWAAEVFAGEPCGPAIDAAAIEAVRFLLLSCRLQSPDFYVGSYSHAAGFSFEGALGASALLLNALLFPRYFSLFEAEARQLVHLLVSCQTPAGAFRAYPHRRSIVGPQRYYSGEALLALIRYSQLTGDRERHAEIERALVFYREYFRRDPHQSLVLWHADAWSRLVNGPEDGAAGAAPLSASALEFVCTLVETVLERQVVELPPPNTGAGPANPTPKATLGPQHLGGFSFGGAPGISSSVYIEAVARAFGACERVGHTAMLPRYLNSIRIGFDFLQRLQITDEEAANLKNPPYAAGGCRGNLEGWSLRIDNDQHVITACLSLLECL